MEKSIHQKRYRTMIALLRKRRETRGMTQIQLAEKLNISQAVVSKIETCERRLDLIELIDVCDAMNVSIVEFFNELNNKL
ncbi:MAG: helix-turn-helix transcriptional regulator [Duncaniella sp.]|nr:helix-turn-helix transcriptional regulator [Duncaniella sp.]